MLGVFEKKNPKKKHQNLRNNIEGGLVNCQFSDPTTTEGSFNRSTTTSIEHSIFMTKGEMDI
jgi:hypothetical protein